MPETNSQSSVPHPFALFAKRWDTTEGDPANG